MKHIEDEIILGMMRSPEFLGFAADLGFEKNQFANDVNGWAYKSISKYYGKYGKKPTKKILFGKINKLKRLDADDKIIYRKHVNKILKRKKFDELDFVKDEAIRYFKRQSYIGALMESADMLESSEDLDVVEKILFKSLYTAKQKIVKENVVDWLENWEQRQEQRKLGTFFSGTPIKTGFYKLDEIIDGVYPGEVLTFAGLTGRGKSIITTNVGASNFLDGEKVLHVTSENPLWQALGRYDARILQLDYKLLQKSKLVSLEEEYADEAIEMLQKKLAGNLRIAEVPPNGFDVLTIRSMLDRLKITENFVPNLVILDSAELMNCVADYKELRLQKAAAYWEFKGLMMEYGMCGITTTQAKVKSDEEKGITSEDLAEAYDKARLLDKIIGITRSIEDILKEEITLHIAKNRDGDSNGYVKLPTDFSKITIMN